MAPRTPLLAAALLLALCTAGAHAARSLKDDPGSGNSNGNGNLGSGNGNGNGVSNLGIAGWGNFNGNTNVVSSGATH